MRDKFIYLLFCAIASFASATSILEKYTREPGNVYHGRFTRDVHEPELLVPRHVNEDGKFGTYELPKFYDRRDINDRRKRSSDSEIDKLHLMLPFNGIDHHVELSPYHEFISPEMVIETRGPGIGKNPTEGLRFSRAPDQQCHYRGNVRGHTNSRAALSLCNGVAGYVQTNEGRYFIEPLNEAEPAADGQHVHMAYRREAPHEKEETGSASGSGPKRRCGTDDNWEAAWAEQLAKREQRLLDSAESRSTGNDSSVLPSKRADTKGLSGTHSIHRFIEIGLVCDRRFLDYYNGTDYEKYLMTIMNMVSDFYHDSSNGNQIDVVVVRVIYLEMEKDEIDLVITPKAEKTLESFAAWAEKMNPKDHKHPNHYDIAVLVTRYDICAVDSGCDLMGLAYLAAACDPSKAAAINEDSGLLLGIVVAHEVGHVMGCSHDEIDSSGCPPQDKDESYFLMSPIVFIFTIRWSTCSRKFMTAFLESGLGECLNDDPRDPPDRFRYPNMLPGAMYDANFQCGFDRPGASYCDVSKTDICERLWCKSGKKCFSKGAPPADGTKCGEKKWCIQKKCVDMGSRPAAVHGGWGEWGPMSDCSRTCGGGIKSAERECNKPTPANGGRYCLGERKRFSTCNTTPCDPSKPSYRVTQCAEYNNKTPLKDGQKHTWTPLLRDDLNPCELYCMSDKNVFMKLSPTTKDATPCKGGTNYMCISGFCRKVGCDWVMDSDAIDDQCGVCKGDGTQCSAVEGEFTKTNVRDYQKVVTIPKGARSILVKENKESDNTLAVKNEKDDKYCLNDKHTEMRNGDYPCAGAIIIYSHPEPQREEISIRGPLTEPIQIQYVFFSPKVNPGVKWKYYVKSSGAPNHKAKYIWDFTEWGECTAKCGGGTMVSNPSCIEESSGMVSPSFCQSIPRPDPKSRTCNEKPCSAKWRVSQWSKCSACDGKTGMKHRKVQCIKRAARPGGDDVQANLNACRGRVPKQKQKCVGTRPCRKMCPKRSRDCGIEEAPSEPKERERSLDEQRRMIDEFVDLGLARYLERTRGRTFDDISRKSLKRDVSEDFRSLLRDWVMLGNNENEEMAKRTCDKDQMTKLSATNAGKLREQQAAILSGQEGERQMAVGKGFVTPKPGSIIKDVVPPQEIVLYEVPLRDDGLKANISDIGFQEGGDIIGVGIDTKQEKVYHGADAANMLAAMDNRNDEKIKQAGITLPTTVSEPEGSTYESISRPDSKAN